MSRAVCRVSFRWRLELLAPPDARRRSLGPWADTEERHAALGRRVNLSSFGRPLCRQHPGYSSYFRLSLAGALHPALHFHQFVTAPPSASESDVRLHRCRPVHASNTAHRPPSLPSIPPLIRFHAQLYPKPMRKSSLIPHRSPFLSFHVYDSFPHYDHSLPHTHYTLPHVYAPTLHQSISPS
jgi:hypothetical protein